MLRAEKEDSCGPAGQNDRRCRPGRRRWWWKETSFEFIILLFLHHASDLAASSCSPLFLYTSPLRGGRMYLVLPCLGNTRHTGANSKRPQFHGQDAYLAHLGWSCGLSPDLSKAQLDPDALSSYLSTALNSLQCLPTVALIQRLRRSPSCWSSSPPIKAQLPAHPVHLPPETLRMPRTLTSRSGKLWPPASATPLSTSAFSMVCPLPLTTSRPISSSPVSNHGIPESAIEQTLGAAKRFFALPLSTKEEVIQTNLSPRSSPLTVPIA